MNKQNDYNTRQLKLMLNIIDMYMSGKVNLIILTSKIESLLHALENINEEWWEKCFYEFTILEAMNSETPNHMKIAEIESMKTRSVIKLKELIEELL